MDAALEKLLVNDYTGAVETYLPAFEISREKFEKEDYGNIIKDAVINALTRVLTWAENFDSLEEELRNTLSVLEADLSAEDMDKLLTNTIVLLDQLDRLETIREDTAEAADTFKENFRIISQQEKKEEYFLHFTEKVLRGRIKKDGKEGILYTLGLFSGELYDKAVQDIEVKSEENINQGKDKYSSGKYDAVEASMQTARSYFKALMNVVYHRDTGFSLEDNYELDWEDAPQSTSVLADFIRAQAKYRETRGYESLAGFHAPLENLQTIRETPAADMLASIKETTDIYTGQMLSFNSEWKTYGDRLQSVDQVSSESAFEIGNLVYDIIGKYLDEYIRIHVLFLVGKEVRYGVEKDRLVNGEEIPVSEDSSVTRVVKYPNVSKSNLEEILSDLVYFTDNLEAALDSWMQQNELISENAEIRMSITNISDMLDATTDLMGDIRVSIAAADEAIINADTYLSKGKERFTVAQASFSRRLYDDARVEVVQAMESLDRSLEYREDAEVRRLRDEVYPSFFNQINLKENEKVITEVRNLIRRGIQLYRDSEFEEAQTALLQAQSRWRDVHPTDNEEVADWLTLVGKAISLKHGWEINETEAPYEHITQLLRLTGADYHRAEVLLKEGKERESERAFQDAIEKLDQIKITFPKLKEANTLRLQIKRRLDPEDYLRIFESDLSSADSVLRSDDQVAILEMFSILKDYERIEGKNKDLQDIIYKYEIVLGLKLPPPTVKEIAESRSMYTRAKDIYDKRQRDLYDTALQLLGEALKLWPDNTSAEDLKDDMLRDLGQTKQTLTSDDVHRIEQAENFFQDKDYVSASRIVQELLKNDKNANNERITDLKKKLEARGY
jgi:hypothetical protein